MKKFRFTLESVGTVRERAEQKALEKYAQALQNQRQAVELLQAAEASLAACWEKMRRQSAEGCTGAEAMQALSFEAFLTQRRDEARRKVEQADRAVAVELQATLLARQQRQIVDKFFDKQREKFQRDQAAADQKALDELAGRRRVSAAARRRSRRARARARGSPAAPGGGARPRTRATPRRRRSAVRPRCRR